MESNEKNPFLGITDVGQAEQTFNQFCTQNPDDRDAQLAVLGDLLDALLGAEKLSGDYDDFHNFAVTISKITSDSKNAYAIICRGLKIHPYNTDLLADAISYGSSVGEKGVCEAHYRTLITIDKARWTWRAFSFTITYLLDNYGSSANNIVSLEEILELAGEYKKYLPGQEEAWLSLSRVYDKLNQRENSIAVLEEAIKKFRFCPKCWLRYADSMVDYGEYEKAEPIIRKMLRNPKTTESINTSYLHFLDGECRFARLLDSDVYYNGEIDEREVRMIYRAFTLARKSEGLRETTNQRIEEYIKRLELETDVQYDG